VIWAKQGQNYRPGYQTLCAPLSGNPLMAGATVHPDVRLRFCQAALPEHQSNARLRSLLLDHLPELFDCGYRNIGA
jgi:hypothetical protein